VGGILAEASLRDCVVVGWGVNLSRAPESSMAISIAELPNLVKEVPAPQKILHELHEAFQFEMKLCLENSAGYSQALVNYMQEIPMQILWGLEGVDSKGRRCRALGIDSNGGLRVEDLENSSTRTLVAGDFTFFASKLSKV